MCTTLITFEQFERIEQMEDRPGKASFWKARSGFRMPPAVLDHMEVVERWFLLLRAVVEMLRQARPEIALGVVHVGTGYLLASNPAPGSSRM